MTCIGTDDLTREQPNQFYKPVIVKISVRVVKLLGGILGTRFEKRIEVDSLAKKRSTISRVKHFLTEVPWALKKSGGLDKRLGQERHLGYFQDILNHYPCLEESSIRWP